MALKLSTDFKNYILSRGIVATIAGTTGTGGTAVIKIYSGAQPANADTAPSGTSGTMLCEIINIGWAKTTMGATSGTASLGTSVGYSGTAAETGVAGWARFETVGSGFSGSAATFRMDGDVGTGATCAFVINSTELTNGGAVSLLTAPITLE